MREWFERIADRLPARLRPGETFACHFSAEESRFVRFNRSRIRQAGAVTQAYLSLDLCAGRRHATGTATLCADPAADEARLERLFATLREQREVLPEDPWLSIPEEVVSTEDVREGKLPEPGQAVEAIVRAGRGRDLVGLFAAGPIHAGFADSRGQRNWHSVGTFQVDWSFFLDEGRAVKAGYAGTRWSDADLDARAETAGAQLEALARPAQTIPRGGQRVYLAPAAVEAVLGVVSWGGFGLRAHRTRTTPLLRLAEAGGRLDPAVTIVENARDGIAPRFQESGFPRPDRVVLIERGQYRDCLVSPRSAAEYGVPCNGASAAEMPFSVEMEGGGLPATDALDLLGNGVWVSDLHYLNFSDRPAGRLTGLTRFATFLVRGGEIVAPLEVMRFDDSLERFLGDRLVGITRERERILCPDTYERRSISGALVPGVLADDFRFVL